MTRTTQPRRTARARSDRTGRYYHTTQTSPAPTVQPPSTAPVTLPYLTFMDGEPMPPGARVARWNEIDKDVGMI